MVGEVTRKYVFDAYLSIRYTSMPLVRQGIDSTHPAAVTCPVMKLPKWLDASMTALYPEMLAMEL